MPYPKATEDDVAFFWEHGFIVVPDAIDPVDLDVLMAHCDEILEKKETMAFDWAWEKGTPRETARVQDRAGEPDALLARDRPVEIPALGDRVSRAR